MFKVYSSSLEKGLSSKNVLINYASPGLYYILLIN